MSSYRAMRWAATAGKKHTFTFNIPSGNNRNLRTDAVSAGWNQSDYVVATTSASLGSGGGGTALTIDGSFPSGVKLINLHTITGGTGNGGYNGSKGSTGSMGSGGAGGGGGNHSSGSNGTTGTGGGNGGQGTSGGDGAQGGRALSISVTCTVDNQGTLTGGTGGNAGGGGQGGDFGYGGGGGGGGGGTCWYQPTDAWGQGGSGGSGSVGGQNINTQPGTGQSSWGGLAWAGDGGYGGPGYGPGNYGSAGVGGYDYYTSPPLGTVPDGNGVGSGANCAANGSNGSYGADGSGGAQGYYCFGNSYVTWVNTGTRNGAVGG